MNKKTRWEHRLTRLADLELRPEFQFRADGINRAHARQIARAIEAGDHPPPIHAAEIDGRLYVLDGFHRHEAHRMVGMNAISVLVASMTTQQAKAHAMLANARSGRHLNRADKTMIWEAYVADARHLRTDGSVKGSRTIAKELSNIWGHTTIRQRLKQMGLELAPADEVEPHGLYGERTIDEMESEEAMEWSMEAESLARQLGQALPLVTDPLVRSQILESLRHLIEAEANPRPPPSNLLDV